MEFTSILSIFGFIITIYLCKIHAEECSIPVVLRGSWFSWENGRQTETELNANEMHRNSDRGFSCETIKDDFHANYTIVFNHPADECYHCVKFLVRTVNVLEKIETGCVNLERGVVPTVERVCGNLNPDQQLITLFSQNHVPVNCRSSLEGVWQFAYQNRFRFTGECNHPEAQIRSCQQAGSQFLITNQKFNITYKACQGMTGTFDGVVEFSCLGDWFVDKNHFFAVANTKESRKDEKYRCFLKNRDDDLYLGVSITAECNTLKTVEKSPERLHINPVKAEVVEPGCRLPQNFTGDWINTANLDADVFINETHIIETWYPDQGRYRRTIYVCREQRDSRFMMARLTVDGCQKDYICFDFVPRHHNIIRYRKGVAVIKDDFHTVCSWVSFQSKVQWKYNLFLGKEPVPVRCPVAGKFNFTQKGDVPFETRILGGVTLSPRPNVYCKENISDFSVCDTDQKEMKIDETYCLSVDHLGRPIDIYSDPDYKLKCVGFWKENLKSYLITYDELDAFSKYRCWVYQRADLNRVLMSQAIGPFCDLAQDVTSYNYSEGAAVALEMQEYERERDRCPMHFDDGSNPWKHSESHIQVFHFDSTQTNEVEDETGTEASESYEQTLPEISQINTPPISSVSILQPSKIKLYPVEQATLETMKKVGDKIDSEKKDDSHDIFGKHVADRLRNINPHQLKFAQKLISDVLFEADMESLTRFWKITGPVDPPQYSVHVSFMNHQQDNPYSIQNNGAPRPHPQFTTEQQQVSPTESSYTTGSSTRDFMDSFYPNSL